MGFEIFQISLKVENRVLRFSFFFAPAARNLMNFRGKSSNFSKNTSKFSPAALKSLNLGSFLKIFARFAQKGFEIFLDFPNLETMVLRFFKIF